MLNNYYGTHYTPDDLMEWSEVDIAEATTLARLMEAKPNAE